MQFIRIGDLKVIKLARESLNAARARKDSLYRRTQIGPEAVVSSMHGSIRAKDEHHYWSNASAP
jgi:hypothetical protein